MPRKNPEELAELGFLPLSLAAENLGISVTTLKNQIKRGKIFAIDISSSVERNEFRIPVNNFIEYLSIIGLKPTEKVKKAFESYIRTYFPSEKNAGKEESKAEN